MDIAIIILFLTLVIYVPLAGILLYVWWKYGKGEIGVKLARSVFLLGSFVLFFYMITF
jgi:heme/copper-type cytochrome/quinol oxidase subunit 2